MSPRLLNGGSVDPFADPSMSVFETCSIQANGDASALLQCISDVHEESQQLQTVDTLSWLLVMAGAFVFFMQTGFAMLCAGCVRRKNVQNTMLKNLLDACGAAIAFYMFGYAFAFGGQNDRTDITFIGLDNFFLMGDVDAGFFFFEFAFCATTATIVAGTLAERCQMAAYLCYSLFLSGFVYPIVVHAIWSNNGFLSAFSSDPINGIGTIDFAGSGVVHLTGGTTALVAAYILGPRRGRFYDSRGRPLSEPKVIPGHSIALQLMGTFTLWFGWYGFNPGSALLLTASSNTGQVAGLAATNTSLSAAAGAISALFTNLYLEERRTGEYSFELTQAMNGSLAGLVGVTAACGTIEHWAAVVIGFVAGWCYLFGSKLLIKLRIDDAVDAIPVHMFAGGWGLLAVGLFSSPRHTLEAFGNDDHVGWFYSISRGSFDAILLLNQVMAFFFIIGWTFGIMTPFFVWLNYMGWFRADSLEEMVGLDISYKMGNHGTGDDDVSAAMLDEFKKKRKSRSRRNTSANESDADDQSWADMSNASSAVPESAPDRGENA